MPGCTGSVVDLANPRRSNISVPFIRRMAHRSDPVRREARYAFACEALSMALVWVTGSSGVGKSTVCALLKNRGELPVDADWQGYSHWLNRMSGQVLTNP